MFDRFRGVTRVYLDQMELEDMAIFKLCLIAFGVLFGVVTPKKSRPLVALLAGITFVATYIPLMVNLLMIFFPKQED